MKELKLKIAKNICYTKLVYIRISKKLKINLSNESIEKLIKKTIFTSSKIEKKGKNYYVYNFDNQIRVTVNANNFRVITTDSLKTKK
ncbi:DUF3781 domain-containing protein [Apilactobacillus timberlakei]|uniref:DUF3781 domain-containing protein n=1 Tax=Apilactobacillus timberlakei TaxID=2008380 RepID=A0ABY2YWA1_9LACO|nr:DUF3781 domain-containing protein [Apilactobacillus timberlakei]TPR13453.1 DUF3781 domain-containing protein [Apilactobacillus timberlakei]TPR15526.1 DUF3781 domain-containing protein [Apilactobacillus timberlakei]